MENSFSLTNGMIVIPAFLISAGLLFYTAVQAALVGMVGQRKSLYLSFAITCLASAGFQFGPVGYYTAGSVAAAAYALHWQAVSVTVFFPSFFAFIANYTGQRRTKPWLIAVITVSALLLVISLNQPYSGRFSTLEADGVLRLPWGEQLARFRGTPSVWNGLARLVFLAIFIWAAARATIQYRLGERRAALFLAAYLVIGLATMIQGGLVDLGVIDFFYTFGFSYLALAVLMSVSLGMELRDRAVRLEAADYELRKEIKRRSQAEETVRERLKFEQLISDLSAGFVKVAGDELEAKIAEGLGLIARFLGVERASIGETSEDKRETHIRYAYVAPGTRPLPPTLLSTLFPWYTRTLNSGKAVVLSRIPDDLPDEAEVEKQFARKEGIKSILIVPLEIGGSVIGGMGFTAFRTERSWPDDLVQRLRLVGEIFANALHRKRSEEALRESEERFRRLSEGPFEGIAITDEGRFMDTNAQFEKMLGYKHEELIGMPVSECVAPESRELVLGKIKSGDETPYEHIALRRDGSKFPVEVFGRTIPYQGRRVRVTAIRDITERKRAEAEVQRYVRRLQVLSARLVEVQEIERRSIARELHDQIGQVLTGLKLTLEMCLRKPSDRIREALLNAQALTDDLVNQVREISLRLRPSMLDDLGLLPTLLWHFEHYTAQTQVRVAFRHFGLERRFGPQAETAAYRIIQEALTNVARHAGVKDVEVRCEVDPKGLRIEVEDRGVGFDPSKIGPISFGLVGMRERAELLGGSFSIKTAAGSGTLLTVRLPLALVEAPRREEIP
ncbi:MAG TPA: PAS domain S-box protein [Nitrospiria bacterium]|nr:PAS domain S-box protein [Nitrospiria bacterium]